MAIADVYDALISKRVYKEPMSHEQAVEIIKNGRGSHFDPDMVDAFLEIQDEFLNIANTFKDDFKTIEEKSLNIKKILGTNH